jgi:hypothetical protein
MEVSGNRVFVAVKNMPIFIVRTKHFVKIGTLSLQKWGAGQPESERGGT